MILKKAIAHIGFMFLLLLSQQLGVTHGISHIGSETSASSAHKKSLPSESQCEQCLAFAAIGSALVDTLPAVALFEAVTEKVMAALQRPLLPSPLLAFNSRAPPAIL